MNNTNFCICENCGYMFDINLNDKGLIFCPKCGAYGKNMFDKKEVKKVKKSVDYKKLPYFETKVVKVRKEKTKDLTMYCSCQQNCEYQKIRPYVLFTEQPKGNWVNGENLDKIKFPCFCSYTPAKNAKSYGQLNKGFFRGDYYYFITDESHQYDDANCEQFYHSSNIERLFKDYNIHILKGKIILFEEE